MAGIDTGLVERLGTSYGRGKNLAQTNYLDELRLADTVAKQEAQEEIGGGSLAGFYGQRSRQQEALESQATMNNIFKNAMAVGKKTGDGKLATDLVRQGINFLKPNFPTIASMYPSEANYPTLTFPKERAKVSAWVEGRNPEGKRVKIGYDNTGKEVTRVLVGPSEGERETSQEILRLQEDWKIANPDKPVPSSIPVLKAGLKKEEVFNFEDFEKKLEITERVKAKFRKSGKEASPQTRLTWNNSARAGLRQFRDEMRKNGITVEGIGSQELQQIFDKSLTLLDSERQAGKDVNTAIVSAWQKATKQIIGNLPPAEKGLWERVGESISSLFGGSDTQVNKGNKVDLGKSNIVEKTYTNPKTGKRIVLRNGKWVPFE